MVIQNELVLDDDELVWTNNIHDYAMIVAFSVYVEWKKSLLLSNQCINSHYNQFSTIEKEIFKLIVGNNS